MTCRWVSPLPRSRVWWVSASRVTTSAGSSWTRRCSALASLSSSAGRAGDDGDGEHGRGSLGRVDPDRRAPGGERVPGDRARELGHAPDVTGRQGLHRVVLAARQPEQAVQALVGARSRVHQVVVGAHGARQHPEHRHLADERVGEGLEHDGERWPGRVRLDLDRGVAGHHRHRRSVGGGGTDLADQVGQPVDADPTGGRAAHHREHGRVIDAPGQGALELVDRRDVPLQVALQQPVVGDDDALDQVVVDLVLERLHLIGDGRGRVAAGLAVVDERGVGEQVGDATELRLLADGQLERRHARAQLLAELVERAGERGPLAIELVDEQHAGQLELGRRLPQPKGLHLGAGHRADDEHRQVGHPQRGQGLGLEVGVAGGVDQVDEVALPPHRGDGQRQRLAAAVLLGLVVADRRAVLHPTEAGDRPGLEQHGLGQRGLAGAAVPDEGHVADPFGRELFHEPTPCSGPCSGPVRPLSWPCCSPSGPSA